MERTTIEQVRELFGENFLGIGELQPLFQKMGVIFPSNFILPQIEYSFADLEKMASDYIFILGISELNGLRFDIQSFRKCFGIDPNMSEPCFYNQDWYLKENFISQTLETRWYILRKQVINDTRAVQPEILSGERSVCFPSAILCVYTFFAYYFAYGNFLWYHDFVWCSDVDHNGDRIYVGKYHDVDGINKNGFSIHRHLALRDCYAAIDVK